MLKYIQTLTALNILCPLAYCVMNRYYITNQPKSPTEHTHNTLHTVSTSAESNTSARIPMQMAPSGLRVQN